MTGAALLPLVDAAVQAAFAGGRAIMAVYGSEVEVWSKPDHSPITRADRDAHDAIANVLEGTQLPMMSEEGRMIPPAERQGWGRYWLVDPLDGTKEFIHRNDEFAVCIALMRSDTAFRAPQGNATPVVGVVYGPVADVLYFAWEGGGAYRQQAAATHAHHSAYERVAMSTRLPLAHPERVHTVLASRSHRSAATEARIELLRATHGEVAFAHIGSALKFGLMAEGAADTYPRLSPTMEWDTAAGQIICTEAGRQLIDLTTHAPMRYNKNEPVNNWFIVQ
ncbi:MAG: 3'(2'),5'-bisphosphate nucleotidase CysQ [Flavobacteriales bacterium]|nr:3'(2'),5'-bisphosphate nucleotidase CysQ [Flavobacteriales bacterium]